MKKSLNEYNLDIQFPAYIESEMLLNRDEYAELLIRKGYVEDPNAPVAPTVKEALIESRLDAIEDSVKKTFSRGRRAKGVQ